MTAVETRGIFLVENLEIHAWHGCNLACESCSHYSSLGLRGGPSAQECEAWMLPWADRLLPLRFSIVGGEPTLNPDLTRIVAAVIRSWPESEIRLVTNGFLLRRHPRLPELLGGRPAVLELSIHHPSPHYRARLDPVMRLLEEWRSRFGINLRIVPAYRVWTRRYLARHGGLTFYQSDPQRAWRACEDKRCRQLFEGRLWKCPPTAYLDLVAKVPALDVRLPEPPRRACVGPDCSDADLQAFLERQAEPICAMCPERPERFIPQVDRPRR